MASLINRLYYLAARRAGLPTAIFAVGDVAMAMGGWYPSPTISGSDPRINVRTPPWI